MAEKILVETRGNDGTRERQSDFFSAILNPKASFGGLWSPKSLPKLDLSKIENMSYGELIAHIFGKIGIDSAIDLESYKNFDDKNLPLSYTRIAPNAFLQNLFTGPTRAFKDMAMQPFGALLCDLAKKRGENYLILTATSGDTGPATLEAIKNKENIFGICMFPKDGTSAVQRRQMTTIDAKNIAVLEVEGDFDTTQNALKNLLNDAEFGAFLDSQNLHLSASNSVNFGRIAFQIIYHAYNYIFLRQNGEIAENDSFDIVVPSGNFGNALGAFYAKLMGIPIAKIIIATNANCVLKDFITHGIYDLRNRALIKTNSPAMDILKSSNVERVLFALFGAERTKELMSDLEGQKYYELRSDELAELQGFFSAYSFDDSAVEATIRHYAKQGVLIDPHTANGILGASNSVLGMQFRTCGNFRTSTDLSLVDSPKISTNTKAIPQSLPLRFCESQNLVKNKSARSAKPYKSFCYFLLSQKVESPLPFNHNLPNKVDSQNLGENQAKSAESSLDSANRKIIICATAEWVKFVPTIKNALDSADSQNLGENISSLRDSAKQAKSAESTAFCHSKSFSCHIERSEISQKNNLVILSDSEISQNRDSSPTAQNDKISDSAPFDEKEAMQKIAQKFNLKIHKNIINLFDKEEKNCAKLSENEIKKAIISLCNKFLEN